MTEQKAYELVKARAKCIEKSIVLTCNGGCDNNCDECDLCYAQGTNGQQEESMEIAVQALEKQIPKKPCSAYDDDFGVYWYSCPVCSTGIGWYYANNNYCKYCGQKLKWSDEE